MAGAVLTPRRDGGPRPDEGRRRAVMVVVRPTAGTVGAMITFRYARLRDGSLRLRVTATDDDVEQLRQVWPDAMRFLPAGATGWRARTTVDGAAALDRFLDALEHGTGTLPQAATAMRAAADRLATAQARRAQQPPAGPVLDDTALRTAVQAHLTQEPPAAGWLFEELGIHAGAVRADLALLGPGDWCGWELKGQSDSLTRLPSQVAGYSATFDRCTLVTTRHHLDQARPLLPPWWGILLASGDLDAGEPVRLELVRETTANPAPVAGARAQLLWREEALAALRARGAGRGRSTARRDQLWQALAGDVDAAGMKELVVAAMRARGDWKPHRTLTTP